MAYSVLKYPLMEQKLLLVWAVVAYRYQHIKIQSFVCISPAFFVVKCTIYNKENLTIVLFLKMLRFLLCFVMCFVVFNMACKCY